MIAAKDAVFWVRDNTRDVMVKPHSWGVPEDRNYYRGQGYWTDPIGAAYAGWGNAKNADRIRLMLETAVDLAMQGYPMATVIKAFAEVTEFKALGNQSYPMCRALTSALVGKCLEPNTMSFEELLQHYANDTSSQDIFAR
jgi:hypothetical protein